MLPRRDSHFDQLLIITDAREDSSYTDCHREELSSDSVFVITSVIVVVVHHGDLNRQTGLSAVPIQSSPAYIV